MKSYYVYMLASRPGGALYVDVTNDLVRRLHEHRLRRSGHTKQYNISQLVWFEMHQTAIGAIQREKNMKHWPRARKTRLIAEANPSWRDLYEDIV